MSEVRIADELRLDAPIDVVWHAIEDPHEVRSCTVQIGRKDGSTKERCVEREERALIAWAIEEDSSARTTCLCARCSR